LIHKTFLNEEAIYTPRGEWCNIVGTLDTEGGGLQTNILLFAKKKFVLFMNKSFLT
jgi:formylmethanofuran dehydrogenase subunit D